MTHNRSNHWCLPIGLVFQVCWKSVERRGYLAFTGNVNVDLALRCQRTRFSQCARENLKEGPIWWKIDTKGQLRGGETDIRVVIGCRSFELPFFPWPLAKESKTTVRVCLSSHDMLRQEASWKRKFLRSSSTIVMSYKSINRSTTVALALYQTIKHYFPLWIHNRGTHLSSQLPQFPIQFLRCY